MGMHRLSRGSEPLKQLTHGYPSIILGVYTSQIIDAGACVNYFGGLDHPRNCCMSLCQLFQGATILK